MTSRKINIEVLEEIYRRYNRRELVHPDPLEFLYNYDSLKDREVVGLIASSLAYGRVAQILKSVSLVLDKMGDSPYNFITTTGSREIAKIFAGFKHRFTTDSDLSYLLIGIKETLRQHGSLNKLFLAGYDKDDLTILPALSNFVSTLRKNAKIPSSYLIPSPQQGSACKRLNLFLRWMIRSDEVDPGGWRGIPAAKLLVPLDTHMYNIGLGLGFTRRKQANLKTATEISQAFTNLCPEDPIKYDFALTRFGIRDDMSLTDLFKKVSKS